MCYDTGASNGEPTLIATSRCFTRARRWLRSTRIRAEASAGRRYHRRGGSRADFCLRVRYSETVKQAPSPSLRGHQRKERHTLRRLGYRQQRRKEDSIPRPTVAGFMNQLPTDWPTVDKHWPLFAVHHETIKESEEQPHLPSIKRTQPSGTQPNDRATLAGAASALFATGRVLLRWAAFLALARLNVSVNKTHSFKKT